MDSFDTGNKCYYDGVIRYEQQRASPVSAIVLTRVTSVNSCCNSCRVFASLFF